MGTVTSTEIINSVTEQLQLQPGDSSIPVDVSKQIVPVVLVGRKNKSCNVVKFSSGISGGITIYTTPTDKDFYLVAATISRTHIATDTSATSVLTITPMDGLGVVLLYLSGVTLTADISHIAIELPNPIKLKRGTAITITESGTYTKTAGTIVGFTEEAH